MGANKRAPRPPTPYDAAVAAQVCDRLASGEYLKSICGTDGIPSYAVVQRWITVEPTFDRAYVRARARQMDAWADDIVEISDDAKNDYMEREYRNGSIERVLDTEHVQRSKLRIETRKWVMSKMAAQRYGDKLDVAVNATVEVSHASDAVLEARTLARLTALGIESGAPLLLQHQPKETNNDDPDNPTD